MDAVERRDRIERECRAIEASNVAFFACLYVHRSYGSLKPSFCLLIQQSVYLLSICDYVHRVDHLGVKMAKYNKPKACSLLKK